jgi:hypothetical protein
MIVVRVDEVRGPDRGLTEREAAIIGRYLRMRQYGEAFALETADDLLEQNAILETSAG